MIEKLKPLNTENIVNNVLIPKVATHDKTFNSIDDSLKGLVSKTNTDVVDSLTNLSQVISDSFGKMISSNEERGKYSFEGVFDSFCKEVREDVAGFRVKVESINALKENIDSLKDDTNAIKENTSSLIKSEVSNLISMLDVISAKIELLENEEVFEYDDKEIKDQLNAIKTALDSAKSQITTQDVLKEINAVEGIIEAKAIKGLLEAVGDLYNNKNTNQVKVSGSITEVYNNGTTFLQGATKFNFTGATLTQTGGTINIPLGGGGGAPGGSTTQVQYNNAGAFGGISGATTDGTTLTTTNEVLNGVVTGTAVDTSSTASTLVKRDVQGVALALNHVDGFTTTVTTGISMTLFNTSNPIRVYTGTASAQTIRLPNTSTLYTGYQFQIYSQSTGTLSIRTSGNAVIYVIPAGQAATFTCIDIVSNVAASWVYAPLGNVTGPASATDNAIARFDTTTGKLIQDSAVTIADTTGAISTNGTQTVYLPDQTNFTGSLFVGNGGGTLSHSSGVDGFNNTAFGIDALKNVTVGYNNVAISTGALQSTNSGSNNVAIGTYASQSNTTGTQNVAIGAAALNANTTGGSNVAIGFGSLSSNTTGTQNIAIGDSALNTSTTVSGNIAIGGAALKNNTAGYSNVAMGISALNQNTTGNNNMAIGAYAMEHNTTGSQNVAVGTVALNQNTTGNNNVAIGWYALVSNSTVSDNVGIGYSVLFSTTTGGSNMGIGTRALLNNTTGGGNVAIGADALSHNTTASFNVAIATNALYNATTAEGNVAIGNQAMYATTTSGYNVAIGDYALYQNTTGSGTSIGSFSLFNATTGTGNTALGPSSGFDLTTGSSNTFIGPSSGRGITTGSNNTIIGGVTGLSATLANNIIIADGAGNQRINVDTNGYTSFAALIKTASYTVAGLPAASVGAGYRAFVTDALTPVFGTAVANGGSAKVPVYSDGTNWIVG